MELPRARAATADGGIGAGLTSGAMGVTAGFVDSAAAGVTAGGAVATGSSRWAAGGMPRSASVNLGVVSSSLSSQLKSSSSLGCCVTAKMRDKGLD